jgi:integrase
MPKAYDERKVIAVACPKCGARPGDKCRTAKGNVASGLHTHRKGVVYPSFLKGQTGRAKRGVETIAAAADPSPEPEPDPTALARADRPEDTDLLITDDYIEKAQRLFSIALGRKSKSTIDAYEKALRDFCRFMEMSDPRAALGYLLSLGRLEAELRVTEYLGWLEDAELSPSTQRLRLSALKFYVKTANRAQWIDWTLEVEGPPQETIKDVRGPTPKEFEAILKEVDTYESGTDLRNRLMVYLLSFLGLRISSVLSIDMQHIDAKRREVSVTWKGKRKTRVRKTVPGQTWALMERWIEDRGDHAGPLFCNYSSFADDAGKRLSRRTAGRIIERIGKRAGVPGLHPHAFRHFSATEALEVTDGNERKTMKHTGHVSRRMIDIYADERRDEAGIVAQAIEDRWKKDEPES